MPILTNYNIEAERTSKNETNQSHIGSMSFILFSCTVFGKMQKSFDFLDFKFLRGLRNLDK